MKREKLVPLIIIAVVLLIVAAAALYFVLSPGTWQQALLELELTKPEVSGISASGFVEAEEITIGSEVGGRIAAIMVAEGDEVEPDEVLVRLDDTLAQAQVAIAQAGLEVAQATLDQVQAGARPEAIRQAEAGLAQAEAARDGAYQAWQDLLAMADNPQELDIQIAQAQAQLSEAEAGLRQAGAMRDAAQIAQDSFGEMWEEHPPGTTERYLASCPACRQNWSRSSPPWPTAHTPTKITMSPSLPAA